MPHLHLSLQHGDDLILKRMKRRHSRDQAIELAQRLRAVRPDMALGADIIAGFPTETEAAFENSLRLIDDCQIAFLHAFPYSPRPGTPAARMPQLEKSVIKDRAARLRAAGDAALTRFLDSQIGRTASVLIEKQEADGRLLGRSETFAPVLLQSGAIGAVIDVTIGGRDGDTLIATPLHHKLSPAA